MHSCKQIYRVSKIYSAKLQQTLVNCYHYALCHSSKTKTKLTIGWHFYWKGVLRTVQNTSSKCQTCQFLIQGKRNFEKL